MRCVDPAVRHVQPRERRLGDVRGLRPGVQRVLSARPKIRSLSAAKTDTAAARGDSRPESRASLRVGLAPSTSSPTRGSPVRTAHLSC